MKQPRSRFTRVVTGAVVAALTTMGMVAMAPAASAADTPKIEVYLADGTTPYTDQQVNEGDVFVVKGTGFDPAANVGGRGVPIPATLPQGTYVAFGSFSPVWQPSKQAPSSARSSVQAAQKWLLAEPVLDQVPAQFQGAIRAGWAPLAADGSFTAEIPAIAPENTPDDGVWGIYTYAAGGVVNTAQELSVPVAFGDTVIAPPPAKVLKSAKPGIKGKATVGKTLKAKVKKGQWTKGTTLTIKWYAAGKVIKKATGSKTLTLTKKFVGKKITVKVTGKKKGFDPVTVKAKTAKVKAKKK